MRALAAKIDANATSATPTMSAAAVAAVRPGWRMAFSRARRPVIPRIGLPISPAIGGTSRGLSNAVPRNSRAAPMPTNVRSRFDEPVPNRPNAISVRPPSSITMLAGNAIRERRVDTTKPSRSAATGGTRVARIAGASAATIVTTTPTTIDTMIVRLSMTVPFDGSSKPIALNSARSPAASPMPSRMPTTAPAKPRNRPSASTERRTWAREAPSVRSIPNSRARCATVIENVLKMMNAPTNSEMPANASSAVCRKPRLSRMSLDRLAASSEPVRTCTDGPSFAVSSRLTACASLPFRSVASISSSWFTLPVMRCAAGSVSITTGAPPSESTPWILTIPTIRKACLGCSAAIRI